MTTTHTQLANDCAETREQLFMRLQRLKLFKSPRSDGALPAPRKQLAAYDQNKVRTRADFAYTGREPEPLSYVDRLTFHSIRQRVQGQQDHRSTSK